MLARDDRVQPVNSEYTLVALRAAEGNPPLRGAARPAGPARLTSLHRTPTSRANPVSVFGRSGRSLPRTRGDQCTPVLSVGLSELLGRGGLVVPKQRQGHVDVLRLEGM